MLYPSVVSLWAVTLVFILMIAVKTIATDWLPKWWVWTTILSQLLCGAVWGIQVILYEPVTERRLFGSAMGFRSILLSGIIWLWMKALEALIIKREREAIKEKAP